MTALEAPWNALAGGMPLRSWDWLATWWNHYGAAERRRADERGSVADRQLYVMAVYDDTRENGNGCHQKLLGVAPWYLDRTIVKGNVIRPLGSGEVCTDHLSLICRPEVRPRVANAIGEALTASCDDWDQLDLSAIDADDPSIGVLMTVLEDRDCLISRHAADACWLLDLPPSWDKYLASVSKSHRKQLRQQN